MTTAYTSLLGLALPVTGELSGTWGDTVNNSITSLLDSAIAGTTTLSADTTLTTTTGASNQARQAILLCTGQVANITITAPAQSKIYTVINASATYTVKIRGAGPTTGITIPVSSTATVAWNGSDFVDASGYINGNLKVNGTLSVTGAVTFSTLTSGRVTYATTAGLLTDSANLLYSGTDLTVYGLTVGRGAGAVASNTAVGASALAANSGAYNSAFGYQALQANTSGNYNQAFGNSALLVNTTGSSNSAIGQGALGSNTTGSNNSAFGFYALVSNTTASNNTAVGYQAGYSNTTGTFNTFIGQQAAYYVTTGSNNTVIGTYNGNQGGLDIRTASNYIVLSDGSGNARGIFDASGNLLVGMISTSGQSGMSIVPGSATYTAIHHATGSASGTEYALFRYNGSGIGSITQNGTTGVLYNLTSDYRLKNDQQALTGAKDFIMALKPKKWQWWDGSGEGVGFVAHEFMEVAKHSGNGEKDAVDADGKPVYQSIQPSSSEVMANLVAFIQEQQALITQLTARITALEGA